VADSKSAMMKAITRRTAGVLEEDCTALSGLAGVRWNLPRALPRAGLLQPLWGIGCMRRSLPPDEPKNGEVLTASFICH
jgi:hypothetical protein